MRIYWVFTATTRYQGPPWPVSPVRGRISRYSNMVPRNIVVPGGTVSEPTGSAVPETGSLSDTEEKVAEVWKEVFELDSVAATDDILELGVGSLHAMVMCQKLCQIFSIDIPYSQLVISPTVRELSTYIDEEMS